MRVVVAEDSVFIREILVLACREFGHDVVAEAQNGDEALAKVAEHNPDLLILDLVLPFKNGVEVAIEVEKNFPETKILAVSSLELKSFQGQARFDGVLGKPFTKQELVAQLQRLSSLERKVAYG